MLNVLSYSIQAFDPINSTIVARRGHKEEKFSAQNTHICLVERLPGDESNVDGEYYSHFQPFKDFPQLRQANLYGVGLKFFQANKGWEKEENRAYRFVLPTICHPIPLKRSEDEIGRSIGTGVLHDKLRQMFTDRGLVLGTWTDEALGIIWVQRFMLYQEMRYQMSMEIALQITDDASSEDYLHISEHYQEGNQYDLAKDDVEYALHQLTAQPGYGINSCTDLSVVCGLAKPDSRYLQFLLYAEIEHVMLKEWNTDQLDRFGISIKGSDYNKWLAQMLEILRNLILNKVVPVDFVSSGSFKHHHLIEKVVDAIYAASGVKFRNTGLTNQMSLHIRDLLHDHMDV